MRVLVLLSILAAVFSRPAVRDVTSKAELDRLLNYHALTGLPVAIDFYSTTCGPCRMIEPVYKRIGEELKGKAVLLKVNVQTTDAAAGIRSMPTFRFYFRGQKVHEFSGADEGQIRRTLQQYVSKAKSSPMKIREITKKGDLKLLLQHAVKMPVVLAFVTKTDDVSIGMWPVLKDLNTKYGGKAVFAKVNIEESAEVAGTCKAEIPGLVHVYVSGKKVDEVTGTDPEALKAVVDKAVAAQGEEKEESADKESKGRTKTESGSEEAAPKAKVVKAKRPQSRTPARIRKAKLHPEKVVIIGAGPAGLSAAIYAARAGLQPVLIAPDIGGALTYTKEVENYPGSLELTGDRLIETLRVQAESFDTQFEATEVVEVNLSKRPFTIITNQTEDNVIRTHTLIVATGAASLWLGVPGEDAYRAKGITTCATCDGYLFKGKEVIVVGGGDTAMEEALFMARIASKVTLVHRRDDFRASYIMQQRVRNHNHIQIVWNSKVVEFGGDGEGLTHAIIENTVTKENTTINVAAAFVAIGHTPNTAMFKGQLGMDQTGYLMTTAGRTHSTVEGVFACGDVADSHYRQAVTSAATGAMAAIDAEHYLDEQGIDVGDGHTEPGDTDYMSWTIAKLKTALKEKGISHRGCVEKGDFIRKLTGQTSL